MRARYALWIVLLTLPTGSQTVQAQTVPVGSSNWFFSPYNWNALGLTEIVTNQPGAYFSLRFADSSRVVLNLDTVGIPASNGLTSMVVQWRIDDTLSPPHTLSPLDTQLNLATGLSSGPHTVQFRLVSSDYHQDRWTRTTGVTGGFLAPAQALRVVGMTLDPGATVLAPNALRPKRILFYGDSITEGAVIGPANDAGETYAITCARLLDAEYGVVGNAGQGWTCSNAPTSGVPIFRDAFAQYYDHAPRFPLLGGAAAPDFVLLNMGTNDAIFADVLNPVRPELVTEYAVAWMLRMRTYLPSSQVFLVVPFGGFYAQALQTAYTRYMVLRPDDTRVGFLNLGLTAQTGLTAQVRGGTSQSFDGIHPNAGTHRKLGYQLTAALRTALGRNDLDGDGKSDLILQNTVSNQVVGWFQNGATVRGGAFIDPVPDREYQIVGSADFNGDGKPDFVFQNHRTGQLAIWYMNGTAFTGGRLIQQMPSPGYEVVGVGDFNGDGKPDIVFQNRSTGRIAFWLMDGDRVLGGSVLDQVPAAGYRVVGTGDFNRDGQSDLLFQDTKSGALAIWYLNGVRYAGGAPVSTVPPPGFHVEAIADFDGDGRPDLALRDPNGNIELWHLDDANVFQKEKVSLRLDTAYRIAGPR
jgi:lysophospholipase L1-like esterase